MPSLTVAAISVSGWAHGQVRLSEILPLNTGTTGYLDDDGSPQGWIELHNPSTAEVVSLAGYRLTNGTASWTIPDVQIMPDDRIVIWASGKNRTNPQAPLHTNFILPPGGGTLSLRNGGSGQTDGVQVSSFTAYPSLAADVSWGRDETDNAVIAAVTGRYSAPTPGEKNNYAGEGVAAGVVFDTPSKAFSGTVTVGLSSPSAGAEAQIRYTTDQSVPQIDSPLYTGPITVSGTQMIRARLFQTGLLPGATSTRAYLALSSQAQSFTSNMPLVVVSNFLTSQPSSDKSDQSAYLWVWEPSSPGARVNFSQAPSFASRVNIHRRGSSSIWNLKLNLSMETRNEYDDDDADAALLGMPSDSDWVLAGPYDYDRALVRNPFSYKMSNEIGRYAPRNAMAEVFLEFTGGSLSFNANSSSGDYFGIYNILEKIRRSKGRQNLSKLEPYDNSDPVRSGGYLWKVDRADSETDSFHAGGTDMVYDYPKGEDLNSPQRLPQKEYLSSYLNELSTQLFTQNRNPQTGYPSYLDVQATIDHHLMNVWFFNVDALRLSAYWHKDRNGKIAAGPLWDFDRSLSSTDGRDSNPAVWRAETDDLGTNFFGETWFWKCMFLDIEFYQQYIDRWQELRRGKFAEEQVNALLDSLNAEMSDEAIARDLARWKNAKRPWTSPFTGVEYPASQEAEIQRIKDFLQQRADFFDSQWVAPVAASAEPGKVAEGTSITLSGPAGATIYYTLDGSDPRPVGGGVPIAANVKVYAGPIPVNDVVRLCVRVYDPNHTALTGTNNPPLMSKWSGMRDLRYTDKSLAGPGNLAITEIHYHPADPSVAELVSLPGIDDSAFEFIELRNISSDVVDLSGAVFTAGIDYTFPAGFPELQPGEFIVIASNPAAYALRHPEGPAALGPWSGNLSNSTETLTLSSTDGQAISSVAYDEAWSSLADGDGYSLVVFDQAAGAADFGLYSNWRTSALVEGSPSSADESSKEALAKDLKLLHYWNFSSSSTLLQPSATIGNGGISVAASLPSTAYEASSGQNFCGDNARNGDSAGNHLRVNYPLGATVDIAAPTTGYDRILVRYETRRSGSGAGIQKVSYTLDGKVYQDFTSYPVTDGTPMIKAIDFDGVEGVRDNPRFGIRITFQQGLGGEVGNNRFDNLSVEGEIAPGTGEPPALAVLPEVVEVAVGQGRVALDLNSIFTDPDDEGLTFTVDAPLSGIASLALDGSRLQISGSAPGSTEVTVRAVGVRLLETQATLKILVHPRPWVVSESDFVFDSWSSLVPAGTFPESMSFLLSEAADPLLTSTFTRAYALGYARSSGTRVSGKGASGISFVNSGTGPGIGGIVAVLDTQETDEVRLSWTGLTLQQGAGTYGLRLQARIGFSGPFEDLTGQGEESLVLTSDAATPEEFGPVVLPEKYLGLPYVQVLWRFYLEDGVTTGARSEMGLDDMVISEGLPHGYEGWKYTTFSYSKRGTAAAAPEGENPAGGSNLLRYALGVGTGELLTPSLPQLMSSGKGLTFPFDPKKSDLAYRVWRSADLKSWSAIFDSDEESWQDFDSSAGTLTIPDSNPPSGKGFYRLQVELK